jgi:hypothetical protein
LTTPRIDDDAMVDDEDGEGVVEAIETLASRDVDADGVARGAWNAREGGVTRCRRAVRGTRDEGTNERCARDK